jgi:uncharacterized protein YwgA
VDRLERAAVVLRLATRLRARGSWCGEIHLQKTIYFLQEVTAVPLGYKYILYMHGPYSFDVSRDLETMRGYGLLRLEPQPVPYDAKLVPTTAAERVETLNQATIDRYAGAIERVVDFLGDMGVVELEKLSTALYVALESPEASVATRAARVTELKPRIQPPESDGAVERVDAFLEITGRAVCANC